VCASIATVTVPKLVKAGFSNCLHITAAELFLSFAAAYVQLKLSKQSVPKVSSVQQPGVIFVGFCYGLGHYLTNLSFVLLQPSFSHTLKVPSSPRHALTKYRQQSPSSPQSSLGSCATALFIL
jgi:hypothetical protein